MINDIITPRWNDFQESLACILNLSIGNISAEGKLLSLYSPLPHLSEIECYPALDHAYRQFFLKVPHFGSKAGQMNIAYDPLSLPVAVICIDPGTYLFLAGGFDHLNIPTQEAWQQRLDAYSVPEAIGERLYQQTPRISLEELETKAGNITVVFRQLIDSSLKTREFGQKMILLTAVDEISKLTVGLLHPGKFNLSQILDLVVNSLLILCDAEGAFILTSLPSGRQFIYRGRHADFERSLREQWEAFDADDPACFCRWDGVQMDPDYGLKLHMTSFAKQRTWACLGVVNPLPADIQPTLKAFGRQVNIVMEISLLYELLQGQVGFLLNSIRQGIIAVNTEGKLMLINQAAINIFKPIDICLAIGQPLAEQGLCPSIMSAVQDTIAGGRSYFLKEDTFMLKENHDKIYLNWDVAPLLWENGDIAGAIVIMEDITTRRLSEDALRQKEQEFRLLVENAPDIIARFDRDLNCTYVNEAIEKQSGTPRDQFIGQKLNQMTALRKDALSALQQAITGAFNDGKERILNLEFPGMEGVLYYSTQVAPEFAGDGSVRSVLAITRNITELKLIEREFLTSSKLESIGMLAGGVAHDFNNFLAIMLGNISLAKLFRNDQEKLYEKLESIEAAILRAKDLTQQLFVFARGSDPVKKTVDLKEQIKESTSFALSGSNVCAEYCLTEDLLLIDADVGQINQVINNIVINAVQAMPQGGNIMIRAENIANHERENGYTALLPEGKYVMFSMEDEGTGIPEKHIANIFDPFFSTKAKGSGLGLSTVYTIIQQHKGHIDVKSVPGVGTTFYVYLPASEGAVQVPPEREKYIKGKGKILIMDDETAIREAAGEMLTHLGYEVELACEGMEAVDLYKKALEAGRPFDAVMLDLTVPGGMGGRDTMTELLALDPGVKAVVASGYSKERIMANYREYGFIDILVKPYNAADLSRAMHRCVSHQAEGEI